MTLKDDEYMVTVDYDGDGQNCETVIVQAASENEAIEEALIGCGAGENATARIVGEWLRA